MLNLLKIGTPMKTNYFKVLMILLSISYSSELFSQDMSLRKSFLIGGEIGISFSNRKTVLSDRTFIINTLKLPIGPSIGYFITNNIAVGAKINYKSEFETYVEDNIKSANHYIMLCPFARYYTKAFIFIEFSPGFGISKYTDAAPDRNKILYYNNSLGLGYALFLNRNISIEPIMTYSLDYISINTGGIKYVLEQNIFLLVSLQVYLNFGSNEGTF
jgi:hypothetical protein